MSEIRKLVTVETISTVEPIVNADALEKATIRGWQVVTRLGEFSPGDRCVYFEIDSALPLNDDRFTFLAPRGRTTINKGTSDERDVHRLKTARLRGEYSQGLALPLTQFPELADIAVGDDCATLLGVVKYEPPVPVELRGEVVGDFPSSMGRKTDAERAQNLHDVWNTLLAAGPWEATEKVDGTSCSVFKDTSGALHVCSRNWELADGSNIYWAMARTYGLQEALEPGTGVQFEIFGDGIQGNPLGVVGNKIAVFNFLVDAAPIAFQDWPSWAREISAPVYDAERLPFPKSVDEAVRQVDGLKSLISPCRNSEGAVWRRKDGVALPELAFRHVWKAINNKYLLKHSG